jgi:prolyl oligopeptidase
MRIAALIAALAASTAFAQAVDTLHGETVRDPFRYLEDAKDPRTPAFFRDQAERAKAALERIPGRAAMLERVRALSGDATVVIRVQVVGSRLFYLKRQPKELQAKLYVLEAPNAAERVLVDPQQGEPGAIDWYDVSPDGRHLAYGRSRGGSEDSVLRVMSVSPARDLGIEIDRTRWNAVGWHPDGKSFYYSRFPAGQSGARRNANARVYRHVLGREASRDEVIFASGVGGARDVPEFVYPSVKAPVDSKFAYAIARDGVRSEIAVHVTEQRDLAAGAPRWRKIVGAADEVTQIEPAGDELYLLTHKGAPHRRVLVMKAKDDLRGARVAVPEGDSVIRSIALAKDALYLRGMVGGIDRLERLQLGVLASKKPQFVRLPFDYAISQLVTDSRRPGAVLRLQGWIEPPMVVEVDARSGDLRNTKVQPKPLVDFSDYDEVRLYAPGHDGVKIPVTLVYRKSTTLTRDNPTLLQAYGSYGIVQSPSFDASRLAWLERGGIFAIAHVRGGGEYGEAWHRGGQHANKLNTVRDMISVSEFLVSYGFTTPRKLAIMGGSAGGIPVGGALVRRPELYGAAIARVPVMDMLRMETSQNGPANVPEFGSVTTRAGYDSLKSISAYHQVIDGAPYPAVMLTAGTNDPRVDAWQPGKMAARLQEATSSGKPVLLRLDFDAGHGQGSSRNSRDAELADIYSFLLWQFGDPAFQVPGENRPLVEQVPSEARAR